MNIELTGDKQINAATAVIDYNSDLAAVLDADEDVQDITIDTMTHYIPVSHYLRDVKRYK